MKTYAGIRSEEGCTVSIEDELSALTLPPKLDLRSHSPTGFEWGYGGSGPAQLALALLADALGDDEAAVRLHQEFNWEVVAKLPGRSWELTEEVIRARASTLNEEERGG
jgi:hypothetical protein